MATDAVFAVDHDHFALNKYVGKPLSFVIYIQVYIHKHSHAHSHTCTYTPTTFRDARSECSLVALTK